MKSGFFEVKSVQECRQILQSFTPVEESEQVSLRHGLHRIAGADISAPEDLPPWERSCMDGYAVRARDCFGAGESNPAYLSLRSRLAVDDFPEWHLGPGECAEIVTGGCLPDGADAVVMHEHTREVAADELEVLRALSPGENVMLKGEDCRREELVLAAGTLLRPQEVGLLAALGYTAVQVRRRPRVAILSTGDELVSVEEHPGPGQIRDVNSTTLGAWCTQAGVESQLLGIVKDDHQSLIQAIQQAVQESDCVILSGGSSVGTRDLTIDVLQSLPGGEVLVHGVAISPGKPTIIGSQGGIPLLGLPGQVTSAQVVMYVLGVPFLKHLGGVRGAFDSHLHPQVQARMTRNVSSAQGREDYVRVRLLLDDASRLAAEPVPAKSGLLRSLVQAGGLLRIPAWSEGVEAGELHTVWLLD